MEGKKKQGRRLELLFGPHDFQEANWGPADVVSGDRGCQLRQVQAASLVKPNVKSQVLKAKYVQSSHHESQFSQVSEYQQLR